MLAKRAKLVYFTAWELANGAKRPVVIRMTTESKEITIKNSKLPNKGRAFLCSHFECFYLLKL